MKLRKPDFLPSYPMKQWQVRMSLCVRCVTNDLIINERFHRFWSTATTAWGTLHFWWILYWVLAVPESSSYTILWQRVKYVWKVLWLSCKSLGSWNRAIYIKSCSLSESCPSEYTCCERCSKCSRYCISLYDFLEGRHAKLAEVQQASATSGGNHPTNNLKWLCVGHQGIIQCMQCFLIILQS